MSDNESPRCSWRMIDVEKAWAIFDAETTPKARRRRNRPLWIVAALIVAYVVSSVPARPYRGDLVRWVDLVLLVLATGVGFWVYVVVVDITRCTSSLMRALSGKESAWPQRGLGAGSPDGRPENRSGLLSEWLDTRLMADLTQVTGGLIYYPFILMLIWGLAHHPIFDNWIVGLEELLNWIGVVALACFPMIVMRQAAGTAQKSAQKRQHTKLMGLLGNDRADDARVLEACIREVRAIRDGAFSPVSQNPVVRAMLIQFGGIGGIAILETLLN